MKTFRIETPNITIRGEVADYWKYATVDEDGTVVLHADVPVPEPSAGEAARSLGCGGFWRSDGWQQAIMTLMDSQTIGNWTETLVELK